MRYPEDTVRDTCAVTVVSDAWNSEAIVEVRNEEATGVVTATPFRVVSVTPNPFNPTMAVHFTLPAAQPVTAAVYSVAGGRVRVLADEEPFASGDNRLIWDGMTDRGLTAASGVDSGRMRHRWARGWRGRCC